MNKICIRKLILFLETDMARETYNLNPKLKNECSYLILPDLNKMFQIKKYTYINNIFIIKDIDVRSVYKDWI